MNHLRFVSIFYLNLLFNILITSDEGGHANCLKCKLCLKDSSRNTAFLVYEEDTSPAQSQRDILEILTPNLELKRGICSIEDV